MSNKVKGSIYVMFPVVAWGISFVSTEFLLRSMGAMTIAAIRFAIATLLVYLLLRLKGPVRRLDRGDRKYFVMAGVIGITAYFYVENTGILYLGATSSALIISTLPVFSLIVDRVFFGRRIAAADVAAVFLSIAGVGCVVGVSYSQTDSRHATLGYVMMFLAVLTWVVYSVSTKKVVSKYAPLEMTFYQFLYSLPFFVLLVPFEHNDWANVGTVQLAHIVFLSLLASVIGFYFYTQAMDLLGITESSLFLNFLPLVTMIAAYFYLGSSVSPLQLLGGILIITSASIVVYTGGKSPRAE